MVLALWAGCYLGTYMVPLHYNQKREVQVLVIQVRFVSLTVMIEIDQEINVDSTQLNGWCHCLLQYKPLDCNRLFWDMSHRKLKVNSCLKLHLERLWVWVPKVLQRRTSEIITPAKYIYPYSQLSSCKTRTYCCTILALKLVIEKASFRFERYKKNLSPWVYTLFSVSEAGNGKNEEYSQENCRIHIEFL